MTPTPTAAPSARPTDRADRAASADRADRAASADRAGPVVRPAAPALRRAAVEIGELADRLALVQHDLASVSDPRAREVWYRLDDAVRSCRHAAEDLSG